MIKDKTNIKKPKHLNCRYCNKGFGTEEARCLLIHQTEDGKTHLNNRKCEDKTCQGRHRILCRYYNTTSGCFRGESCQYLPLHRNKVKEN